MAESTSALIFGAGIRLAFGAGSSMVFRGRVSPDPSGRFGCAPDWCLSVPEFAGTAHPTSCSGRVRTGPSRSWARRPLPLPTCWPAPRVWRSECGRLGANYTLFLCHSQGLCHCSWQVNRIHAPSFIFISLTKKCGMTKISKIVGSET